MDSLLREILWIQYGAALDTLDYALSVCPDELWRESVWPDSSVQVERTQLWYVAYHTVFWGDVYLFGREEGFAPPAPFALIEQDDANGPLPDRVYSKAEVRGYLADLRQRYHAAITALTEERARQPVEFGWMEPEDVVTYAEVQLYAMRHIQGHAAELSLFLGQRGVTIDAWATRAKK